MSDKEPKNCPKFPACWAQPSGGCLLCGAPTIYVAVWHVPQDSPLAWVGRRRGISYRICEYHARHGNEFAETIESIITQYMVTRDKMN